MPQIFLHAQKSVEQKSLRFLWGFISSMQETRVIETEVMCKIHKTARWKTHIMHKVQEFEERFQFLAQKLLYTGQNKKQPQKGR